LNETHDWQVSQASMDGEGRSQLIVLARIRAQVVLPTPLGPQNRNACASWLFFIAFLSVFVIDFCPTTVSNVCGRYFLADTIKFSISGSVAVPNYHSKVRKFLFFM
jgi:hypothetical protein